MTCCTVEERRLTRSRMAMRSSRTRRSITFRRISAFSADSGSSLTGACEARAATVFRFVSVRPTSIAAHAMLCPTTTAW